jgi:hypothetical protein
VTLPALDTEELKLPSTGVNLPGDKTSVPSRPTPLTNMPLELAPPTAAEKSKLEQSKSAADAKSSQPTVKGESTKSPANKAVLPADVLSPAPGAPKAKAPR